MKKNETLKEAILREINEELGITPNNLQLIGFSKTPIKFKFAEIKLSRMEKSIHDQKDTFLLLSMLENLVI